MSQANPSTPSRAGEQPTAVFIHVPKTGGSTINGIINRQYPRNRIVGVGFNHLASQERFLAMSPQEKAGVQCLRGHVAFGIQDALPGPYCLVTLLRDPVARFLSEYKHLAGRGSRVVTYPPEALASLEAHLEYRVASNSLNLQTAQISGYLSANIIEGKRLDPLPDDALARALANLEAFDIPGVLDRFDECLLLMKRRLGWRKPVVSIRKNMAVKGARKFTPSTQLREEIARQAAPDLALYRRALELIDQRIAAEGDDFAGELARLRRANHLLFRTQKVYEAVLPKNLRRVGRKLLGR
ncbi:sulfotransferase family 2 domain-containing protein [bacterium]|nr:sulfotransferase family 2 domain-containing protein [bacterium]